MQFACYIRNTRRIALLPGTSFEDSFRFSTDSLWQRAWNERISPYIDTYAADKKALIDQIIRDPGYTLFDNYFSVITFDAYKSCEIMDIPKAYDPKAFAYAFAKDSPYLPIFNYYLHLLRESGSIDQIMERYVSDEEPACTESSGEALGFDNCFTAFILLLSGFVAAAVLFLVEWKLPLAYFHDSDPGGDDDRRPVAWKKPAPVLSDDEKNRKIAKLQLELRLLKMDMKRMSH